MRKKLTRSSKHILKYSNKEKLIRLDQLFDDYFEDLSFYARLILAGQLPLERNLSSRLLPINKLEHSQWRQIVYKQASEMIRGTIASEQRKRYNKVYSYFSKKKRQKKFLNKYFKELKLNNHLERVSIVLSKEKLSISVDERLISYDNEVLHFNEFVGLKLPYFQKTKKRAIQINLLIKWHKQSLKYKNWNRKKTAQLKKIKHNFNLVFIYEKENPFIKKTGQPVGFDIGVNKLLADSNSNFYGQELKQIYKKIRSKENESKNKFQTIVHRNNEINRVLNSIDLSNINLVVLEDLFKMKNKPKYWVYPRIINKLEMLCQEHGIKLKKVSPAYTSQICSECGFRHTDNRSNESFKCLNCRIELDADLNAARNILRRGVYNFSAEKKQKLEEVEDFINFY